MSIVCIAAYNNPHNMGIGYNNKIPWYNSEDLKFFKNTTNYSVVIMGRKTYQSIGRPLPNRINLVISSTTYTPEEALVIAKLCLKRVLNKNIYVIGGATIYEYFNNIADQIILTEIPGDYQCDTYYPKFKHKLYKTIKGNSCSYNYYKNEI